MSTVTLAPTPLERPLGTAAVLAAPCDGYAAGTTGSILGTSQGCLVFAPDHPEQVARWATARATLLVPHGFAVTLSHVA